MTDAPATRPTFDAGNAASWAWRRFRANTSTLVLNTLVLFVCGLVVYAIAYGVAKSIVPDGTLFLKVDQTTGAIEGFGDYFALIGILYLVTFVLAIPLSVLSAGYIRTGLRIADGDRPGFADMFRVRRPVRIMLTSAAIALASLVGLIFLYIPGLAVALFSGFAILFIVDKDLAPVEAIKASVSLVKANFANAIIVTFLAGMVSLIGIFALVIGILASAPVGMLMHIYAYRYFTGGTVAD